MYVFKTISVSIIKCPMLKTYERDFAQNPRSCDFPRIGGWLLVTDEVKSRSVVKARVELDSDFELSGQSRIVGHFGNRISGMWLDIWSYYSDGIRLDYPVKKTG